MLGQKALCGVLRPGAFCSRGVFSLLRAFPGRAWGKAAGFLKKPLKGLWAIFKKGHSGSRHFKK